MAATTEAYNCGCGGPNPTSNIHLDPDVWGTWSGEQFTPNLSPSQTSHLTNLIFNPGTAIIIVLNP